MSLPFRLVPVLSVDPHWLTTGSRANASRSTTSETSRVAALLVVVVVVVVILMGVFALANPARPVSALSYDLPSCLFGRKFANWGNLLVSDHRIQYLVRRSSRDRCG